MTRIVCTSDTHSKHKQVPIPDGDIFIHAGDLTPRGNHNEFISVGNWFHKLKDQFKHRIFIAGNHDFSLMWNNRMILTNYFDPDVIYLEDSGVELEGLRFYGSPWMPWFHQWAFMKHDHELKSHWDAIPDDTDVLITHCPPYDILDMESEPRRCGSETLRDRVMQLIGQKHDDFGLKHHVFGHIHEAYGQKTIGTVSFHNVCALNGEYKYQNPPQVFDL